MFRQLVSRRRVSTTLIVALLAVEFVDEFVFGALSAAWPLIRADLRLSYEQIGILTSLPVIVGCLVEPAIGVLGDTHRRRALLIGGGTVFVASIAAAGFAHHWLVLLAALAAFNPASGAFVGLSQATLMDTDPARHEPNMARWVVAGSVGVLAGTGLVAVIARASGTWRAAFFFLAGSAAIALAGVAATRVGVSAASGGPWLTELRIGTRAAIVALRRASVRRWLVLLECSDLMLDVLAAFLALYLVDVAGATPAQGALGAALFTGVGLGGDALLIPILERVDGLRYLRASVWLTIVAFPTLLLVPGIPMKLSLIAILALLNSGWYSIPSARLYAEMPGQSGTVMTLTNAFGLLGGVVPLVLGAVADRIGLASTMWLLLIGPLALLIGLPATSAKSAMAVKRLDADGLDFRP